MPKFKPGNVVMLKSGGPRMAVEEVSDDGTCFCVWFDGTKRLANNFAEAVLRPVEDTPSSGFAGRG